MARNGLRIVYPFDVTLEVDSLYTHWFAILCSSVQIENCLTYLLFLQRAVSLFIDSGTQYELRSSATGTHQKLPLK